MKAQDYVCQRKAVKERLYIYLILRYYIISIIVNLIDKIFESEVYPW